MSGGTVSVFMDTPDTVTVEAGDLVTMVLADSEVGAELVVLLREGTARSLRDALDRALPEAGVVDMRGEHWRG